MLHQRSLYKEIKKHLNKPEYTIIIGPRQVGKTTLIKQLQKDLEEQKKEVTFLNLERHSILDSLNQNPDNIFKFISPLAKKTQYLLIDEIQYLDDPANFLKLIFDDYHQTIKIIATGSSAFYIDQKFTDSLAGRKRIFNLHSLSFEEYLIFNDREDLSQYLPHISSTYPKAKTIPLPIKGEISKLYDEYIIYGAYPRVVLEKNHKEKMFLLMDIVDSVLRRDILESNVRSEKDFYKLIRLLAFQIGNLVNINEISSTLAINRETVESYLHILEKIFYVQKLEPFYENPRNELTKMPKIYFLDTGIRNAITQNFDPLPLRADKGSLLENAAFKQFTENFDPRQIQFWRTQYQDEVDFVIDKKLAIEIKANPKTINQKKYTGFNKKYPNIPLIFACLNADEEESREISNIWEL